jgi:hypothetical protein
LLGYIIYAGADWRDVPGTCFEIEALFRRDNVVKKPIFGEKLVADCLFPFVLTFVPQSHSDEFLQVVPAT